MHGPSTNHEKHVLCELGSMVISEHLGSSKTFLQHDNSYFGHLNKFGEILWHVR